MNIKEAAERFPSIKKIEPFFPDDTSVGFNGIYHTVTIGLNLHIEQEISDEVLDRMIDSASLSFLPRDWYRRLHEELIRSEVSWSKKMNNV